MTPRRRKINQAPQLAGRRREARRLYLDQLVVADHVDHAAVDDLLDAVTGAGVQRLQRGMERTFAIGGQPRRYGHRTALAVLLDELPSRRGPGVHPAVQVPDVGVAEVQQGLRGDGTSPPLRQ